MIFSKHRRKLDAKRRFGSRDFQAKVKQNQNYKRIGNLGSTGNKFLVITGIRSRFFRVIWISVIALLFYFFVISNYFVIQQVEISGNVRVDAALVQQLVEGLSQQRSIFIPKTNIFILSRGRLNQVITDKIPLAKEIANYHRSWPNKAKFELVERNPAFVIRSNERDYLVDEEGIVVATESMGLQLPLVIDQVPENFDIGEPLPNTKMVAFILSMHRQWGSKIASNIAETKIPGKASNEVQIVSAEGWGVFFDTNRSVTSQLNNLGLILSKQISARDRTNLAYIDLRLSKSAYYCFKNTPCVAGASEPEEGEEEETNIETKIDAEKKP